MTDHLFWLFIYLIFMLCFFIPLDNLVMIGAMLGAVWLVRAIT